MKRAKEYGWGITVIAFALALQYGVSCDTESPTQPAQTLGDGLRDVAAQPAPGGGQSPTQPGDSPGAGILRADLSSSTETEWCAEFTNDSPNDEWGTAVCYEDPNRDLPSQALYDSSQARLRPGESRVLCASKPCGLWQCDAVNLRGLPPKTNPAFGSNLLLGRIGRNSAASCKPPTTTTVPVCVPEGEPDGYNCRWNSQVCEWECQTCEQANPPSASGWAWNVSSTHVTAELSCANAAECAITIWAGSENNPFRYRKDHDGWRGVCGQGEDLEISYRHRGHNACLWTLVASGPGLAFNREVINRCD